MNHSIKIDHSNVWLTHLCDDDFEIKIGIFEISQLLKLDIYQREFYVNHLNKIDD